MKITFIIPNADLSGGIRVVAAYAERLKKRGHDVLIVSPPKLRPTPKQQAKSVLKGKGWISHKDDEPSHFDNNIVPLKVLERYRPVINTDVPDADVVVATWWETAEWVAQLSLAKGAKAYLIQHYEIFDYLPKDRVKATWTLPMHKIVVAQWLADLALNEYGDPHTSYVPNGVDLDQFYAPRRSKQAVPTIGMMYAGLYWKGSDISLKALALATEKIPNLRLVTFGHSKITPYLSLPEGAEYTHMPPQSSIREMYSKCDAWLFGSRFEGFGLPILEAMACRTPVIGAPAGAAPELLANGTGLLVKPEDPVDMARAIEQVCKMSESEWLVMSDKAYEVVQRYSWEDATDRFEAGLHTAIERQRRGDFFQRDTPTPL